MNYQEEMQEEIGGEIIKMDKYKASLKRLLVDAIPIKIIETKVSKKPYFLLKGKYGMKHSRNI